MQPTVVLLLAFVAVVLSSSLQREIVPSGTVVNVGKDVITILPPGGEAYIKSKENAHQVRDWGHIANGAYEGEFTFVSYDFTVPPAPKDQYNNIIYYFHKAELANGDSVSLYLTYYGDFIYPEQSGWTLSINAGLVSSETPILPGTPLKAIFAQAGNYWNVTALSNNVVLRSIAVGYNTTQNIVSTSAGLEVYLVNECDKYPASGSLVSSNIVVKQGATVKTPVWTPYVTSEQSNQCNFQVSTTSSSISITWNNFNAPPTPTPFPLIYDYTCENGTTVYPDPESGTIRSNPVGTTYGPNLDCSFFLLAPEQNQHVRLDFSKFEFGRYGGRDQIRVYDAWGPDFNGAPLPLAFVRNGNGNSPLPVVVTKGRQAFIKFTSDGSLGYGGFVASYSFVESSGIPQDSTYTCGPNVSYFRTHSPKGYLRSNNPSVDANYFTNVNCGFNITAPAGKKVYFSFSRFALASTDSVKIYDGSTPTGTPYRSYTTTAPATLPRFTTTGSNAYVQFSSDAANTAAGFSIYYDFRN